MEPSRTPMKIQIQNEQFKIRFFKENQFYTIKVSKDLSKDYYEKIFLLEDLGKENSAWQQIKDIQQFENLVLSNINNEIVESYIKEKKLILVFVIIYEKNYKIEFPLSMEKKENDISNLFDEYSSYVRGIDNKLDQFIKNINTKFDELEQKLEVKNKEILNENIERFEKQRKEEMNSDIASYREMKLEIFKDVNLLMIMKLNMQGIQNIKNDEVEYLYNPFLPPQNNDAYTVLSNGNYTLNRTTGNLFGMKCSNVNKVGKFVFSMRIDSYSSGIMIGFCISNKVNISTGSGYNSTSLSYMFNLNNNYFYNKGSSSQYSFLVEAPKIGDIFSVFLDTKNRCMVLYYNGRQLSIPKPINVADDEKIFLAPCVDMAGSGSTITLVEFKEIAI